MANRCARNALPLPPQSGGQASSAKGGLRRKPTEKLRKIFMMRTAGAEPRIPVRGRLSMALRPPAPSRTTPLCGTSKHPRMVQTRGVEPPWPCGHQPLKLARIPIPPRLRGRFVAPGSAFSLARAHCALRNNRPFPTSVCSAPAVGGVVRTLLVGTPIQFSNVVSVRSSFVGIYDRVFQTFYITRHYNLQPHYSSIVRPGSRR